MSDPESNTNQSNPSQRSREIAGAAEGKEKDEKAIPDDAQSKDAASQSINSWRIIRMLGQGWRYVKSSEFTNLAMALATIAIAIFTWLTYEVVTSGSQDTRRLITAAETQANAADEISGAADDFTDSAYWMEEHMEDAANAMQDSVDTADRNTKTTIHNAQQSFRDEQRAWVGVQEVVAIEVSETKGVKIALIFSNSGRTPARNVQTSARYKISDVPLAGPPLEEIERLSFRPAQSIAPQQKYTQVIGGIESEVVGEPYTQDQISGTRDVNSKFGLINGKKLILYYFGILKYDDSFGKHRKTQFCVFLADPATKQMGFCDTFNDLN